MENAVKALLIAAGVLVGIMIISLMLYGRGEISSYYKAKEEAKEFEQLSAFNKQYIPYNREDVRGSDILTLVNKIIDFNNLKEDDEEITISIRIPNNQESRMFYYKYDETQSIKLISLGRNYDVSRTENEIAPILDQARQIEKEYPTVGMAKKLTENLSTLMGENARKTKNELLEELKIADTVNNNEILKYYQYLQFKRAHFDCEELEFTNQGRVRSFSFIFNGKFE